MDFLKPTGLFPKRELGELMSEIVKSAKAIVLKLHACIVAKRGKGVTGTTEVTTFGIPIPQKNKKGKVISKRTKKWDYDFLDTPGITVKDCITAVEKTGLSNRLLKEAILRGADLIRRSQSIQEQSQKSGLVRFIVEQRLAMDKKHAENLASIWIQTQAFMKRTHAVHVPSFEELAEQQRAFIKDQIAKGLWVSALVDADGNVVSDKSNESESTEEAQDDSSDETPELDDVDVPDDDDESDDDSDDESDESEDEEEE